MASKLMEIDELKAKVNDLSNDIKRIAGKIDPDRPSDISKQIISLSEKIDILDAYQKALSSLM
jgi:uncharacterized coiled-coil DUF342 family protein